MRLVLLVLLVLKAELYIYPAELVYSQELRLLSEIFIRMENLVPVYPRKSTKYFFVPESLNVCMFVFAHVDKIRTGLTSNLSISIDKQKSAFGIHV